MGKHEETSQSRLTQLFSKWMLSPRKPQQHSDVLNAEDSLITKDGIPSGCVPTKSEDVGVVSRDHS